MLLLGSFLIVLVCLDLGIKQYIEEVFREQEERETIVDKLVLRKIYNRGFLLNVMDKKPKVVQFSSAVLGVCLVIYDSMLCIKRGRWMEKLAMTFATAGAISNIYDRLIRGKVIDYIGYKFKSPRLERITANLADIYLAIGAVLLMIINALRRGRK